VVPLAPVDPAPEVIVTRSNVTFVEALTHTAMLDSPALDELASGARNAMSSICTGVLRASTFKAKLAVVPVTTGTAEAE
jgi:hypothetical protein